MKFSSGKLLAFEALVPPTGVRQQASHRCPRRRRGPPQATVARPRRGHDMSDVKTETIPAATETGAQDANDAMTEAIPAATETGAQDGSDAMTEAIPSVNEAGALAESAEIIWTGPHPAIAESAEVVWSPATMVELAQATADAGPPAETVSAGDTAQFIVTAGPPETVTGSEAAQAA